jgi:predicted membrane chloride channel (bestrophin family)
MPRVADSAQGGVARLVEAERRWQSALDEARAHARDVVAKAKSLADAREVAGEAECRDAAQARSRELDESVHAAADAVRSEFAARALRYTNPPAELVERLAHMIADRAPWFATPVDWP